ALLPEVYTDGLCVTVPNPLVTEVQAVFLEIIATMALVLVVCTVWDPRTYGQFDSLTLKLGLMIATIFISV
ncbi:Major intrinsic protein, partial [Popillia japonica]